MKLAREVYRGTGSFPKHELYGLTQQIRRAAVSVPSNVAEGKGRHSDKEFAHFLFNARGSLLELQTQLILAEELEYLSVSDPTFVGSGGMRGARVERFDQFVV